MPDDPIGLERGTLQLSAYSRSWVSWFDDERARLLELSHGLVTKVEHVGSTAVPGLASKPVIDLQAAVAGLDTAADLIPLLVGVGYTYMPERVYENRVFLPKGPDERRTHYLSLIEADSDEWRVRLRFRDALRSDVALRDEYEALKRRLMAEHAGDRLAYTAGKSDFVGRVLAESAGD